MHHRRVKHTELSPVAALVRRHDPDRFFTALFAPEERREALLLLYAFNHELARAREVTAEPTIALIRLQWWREVVEGAERKHEIASPLRAALAGGILPKQGLLDLIEAREAETEPTLPTLDAWRRYVLGTAGGVAACAGRILGADSMETERLRLLGAAYGTAGILRSVRYHARQGRVLLPEERLAAHGLSAEAPAVTEGAAALRPVLQEIAEAGRDWLRRGQGRFSRSCIAAALPAVLARRDLRRSGPLHVTPRGLNDRLAVLAAAATRRI